MPLLCCLGLRLVSRAVRGLLPVLVGVTVVLATIAPAGAQSAEPTASDVQPLDDPTWAVALKSVTLRPEP